jgi:hypothetical protein
VQRRSEESLEATNIIRTPNGQRLEQHLKVVGGREYGLPGPTEQHVYVAIIELVYRYRAGGGGPTGW